MVEEGYPVPMPGVAKDYTEYVFTSDEYDVVAEDSPIFSVDCEMCMTTAGKNELTRICVVNNKLEVRKKVFVFLEVN
jgi:RNA exonuclease 1